MPTHGRQKNLTSRTPLAVHTNSTTFTRASPSPSIYRCVTASDECPPPEANLRQGELLNVDPTNKNMFEILFLGEHAMRDILKSRRKLIRLHDFEEVIREEYPHQVFFEYGQ